MSTTATSKIYITCIGVLLVIIGLLCYLLSKYKSSSETHEQNYIASQDSLRQYELKNGELLSARSMYVLESKSLAEQLQISQSTISDLQKQLGSDVQVLASVTSSVAVDTIILETLRIGTDTLEFSYKDEYLCLDGQVVGDDAELNNITTDVSLTIGTTADLQFFVSTSNPYVHITDIIAGTTPKTGKSSRWNISAFGGVGMCYGLINKQIDCGPMVGVGVSYRLY